MLLTLAGLALAGPSSHAFPPSARTLTLNSVAGNITVKTGGNHIAVDAKPRTEDSMCEVVFEGTEDAVVHSRPRGKGGIVQRDCAVDFTVTLPAGAGVDLNLSAGNVDYRHDGALVADVAAGNVEGTLGSAGNLKVAAGNVALGALAHPIEVSVGAGNVALVFTKAPAGAILVNVSAGGVYVDLPDDAPVDARVPPGVTMPQPQKTTAGTKLMIGKALGEVTVE